MSEHSTKNTTAKLSYCPTCRGMTSHKVYNGRLSNCENPHAVGLSKKQEKSREKIEKSAREPTFVFETDEEYDRRHNVPDTSAPLWQEAAACIPDGYEMVMEGNTQEGDIGYGGLGGGWGVDHPYTLPEFYQVLNCGVGHFHAIARKRSET